MEQTTEIMHDVTQSQPTDMTLEATQPQPTDMTLEATQSQPTDSILTKLAADYRKLKHEKAEAESLVDEIKAELKAAETALVDEMLKEQFQNFNHAGMQFCLVNKVYASPQADKKEELFAALRDHDCGGLIYETVNSQTFSSFVREQCEENDGETPDWLDDLVNVYEQTSISMRTAVKKGKKK